MKEKSINHTDTQGIVEFNGIRNYNFVETFVETAHNSLYLNVDSIPILNNIIVRIPSNRLETRNSVSISDYLQAKALLDSEKQKLRAALGLIEPRFIDWNGINPIESNNSGNFQSNFGRQGSGVVAMVTPLADILSVDGKVILFDEPEIGLNPYVKQSFLKFLLRVSNTNQVFIATQDPTFVNPIIWEDANVSLYSFTPDNLSFVKVDNEGAIKHLGTFAGFFPQTVSLKKIHIYVEGPSDAYIFQIFLEKYLKKNIQKEWFKIINEIGIYHVGGDFFRHILYTIPEAPYKSIVILDNNKKKDVKKILPEYNDVKIPKPKIMLARTLEEITEAFRTNTVPIYCLPKDCIESYLGLNCKNLPNEYNKVKDGPNMAEKSETVPDDLDSLFERVLGSVGYGKKKFV